MTFHLNFVRQSATVLATLLVSSLIACAAGRPTVPNFSLIDQDDANHELQRTPGRAVVLMFTGTGCPIVRKNASKFRALKDRFEAEGVTFWLVNSYAGDTKKDVRQERADLGLWSMTYLLDTKQALSLGLGVERTAEVVAIDTKD